MINRQEHNTTVLQNYKWVTLKLLRLLQNNNYYLKRKNLKLLVKKVNCLLEFQKKLVINNDVFV